MGVFQEHIAQFRSDEKRCEPGCLGARGNDFRARVGELPHLCLEVLGIAGRPDDRRDASRRRRQPGR